MPFYHIAAVDRPPQGETPWQDPIWNRAEPGFIDTYHPRSSAHRPLVEFRACRHERTLYVRYRVEDRHVRCAHTAFQAHVCEDSCVEFFVQPLQERGYLNFEMNCGGTLLASYVEDPARTPTGFAKYEMLPPADGEPIRVDHSLTGPLSAEIAEAVTWHVQAAVPVAVLEKYVGPLGDLAGQRWRGNFYKCADASSHPHWGAWSDIGETLDFHQPARFGTLILE